MSDGALASAPPRDLAHLVRVPLDDDALILDPASGALRHVDARGAAIHALLAAGATPEEIATAVAPVAGVGRERVLADIRAFVETCRAQTEPRPPVAVEAVVGSDDAMAIDGRFALLGTEIALSVDAGTAAAEVAPLVDALRRPSRGSAAPLAAAVRAAGHGRWSVTLGEETRTARSGEVAWAIAEGLAAALGLATSEGTLAWHAAAVLAPAGAVLFVGEAGAGKSTLAAALAAEGFPHLADDVVPVCPVSATVWPSPWAISAKPGSWAVLAPTHPRLARARPWTTLAGKRVRSLEPVERAPAARYPIAAILAVSHAPDASATVAPWSTSEAVGALAAPFGGLPRTADGLASVVEAVRRARRARVAYPSVQAFRAVLPDLFAAPAPAVPARCPTGT